MRFLVLTGMSGAGKTSAARYLEDMGAFCVDNLPPMMMLKFMEACQSTSLRRPLAALAVDVRSGEFFDAKGVSKLIRETQALGYEVETLFLDAADEVLVSRYKETRRDHPLADDNTSLTEAIAMEREMLAPLRETANYVIDTSTLRTRALQKKLQAIVNSDGSAVSFRIEIMSFGFKRGIPRQGDLVYDVRFLPNPFYIEGLGRHTGLDEDVRDFVMNHPVTEEFMQKATDMLDFLLPHYQEEGKHRLVIAVGCTGGAHRSVAIAEAIGRHLRDNGYQVDVNHRDLEMEKASWAMRFDGESGD
ncbi:MAG: RNase adapter RapZ [Clostridia bacterium]|nr:RNase adapter RapZ [Clostridia bacterium]